MKIDSPIVKELPLEFKGSGEVRGFMFSQVGKTDKGYVYQVSSGGEIWYEVFERKVNGQYGIISYPKSKSFGKWAWSYMSLQKAMDKLSNISVRNETNLN